jgi:hypothetical protein
MLFRFIHLSLFCTICTSIYGQAFQAKVYTEEDGLASNVINSLAIDTQGRLWCATRSGISIYDGVRWQTNHTDKLKFSWDVSHIQRDEMGLMWAAQNGWHHRVAFHDGSQWHYLPKHEYAKYDVNDYMGFAVTYWNGQPAVLLSFSGALSLWYGETWQHIDLPTGRDAKVRTNLAVRGNAFYIATNLGLMRLAEGSPQLKPVKGIPARYTDLRAIAMSRDSGGEDKIWLMGLLEEKREEWIGTLTNGQFHLVHQFNRLDASNFHYSSLNLLPDRHGGLFIGFSHKVFYWDPLKKNLSRAKTTEFVADGMFDGLIDREGILWIGTTRGLQKITSPFIHSYAGEQGLLENEVSALLELGPDTLLIGHNKGLTLKQGDRFITHSFPVEDGQTLRVVDMDRDREGVIWFSCLDKGVGRLRLNLDDPDLSQIEYFHIKDPNGDRVFSVAVDADNQVWALSYQCLNRYENGKFVRLNCKAFGRTSLRRMLQDDRGNFYLATGKKGLFLRTGEDWQQISSAEPGYNNVYSIARDVT